MATSSAASGQTTNLKRPHSPSHPVQEKLKKTSISTSVPLPTSAENSTQSETVVEEPALSPVDVQKPPKSEIPVSSLEDSKTPQDTVLSAKDTLRDADETLRPPRYHTRKRSRDASSTEPDPAAAQRVTRPRRESQSPILEEKSDGDDSPDPFSDKSIKDVADAEPESVESAAKNFVNDVKDSEAKPVDSSTKKKSPDPAASTDGRQTPEPKDKPATAVTPPQQEKKKPADAATPAAVSPKATASPAFASSGFSAFASASASPFGKPREGPSAFASALSGSNGAAKPGTSIFSTPKSGAPSAFGGFGSFAGGSVLGSPFGGAGKGPGITSFASSKPEQPAKADKPFGAPVSEDESVSSGDEDEASEEAASNSDPRLVRQENVETGEEEETTFFSCRAKMFEFNSANKEWKERGSGQLKLLTTAIMTEDGEDIYRDEPFTCRLLLRTEGVHRLILNQALFKGLKYGDEHGKRPVLKQFRVLVSPSVLLKIAAAGHAAELYDKVQFLLNDEPGEEA